MPATVFVTAYDTYALTAFEVAAADYLVKPFDDERFEQAFRRARRSVELGHVERLSGDLLAILQGRGEASRQPPEATAPRSPERIAVKMHGQVRVVPVTHIDYIVAGGPYAELHVGERRYLIRESMQALEVRLDPAVFLRVHRSAIVRLELVETLHRSGGGDYAVQLRGGAKLKVSRGRVDELERRMGMAK